MRKQRVLFVKLEKACTRHARMRAKRIRGQQIIAVEMGYESALFRSIFPQVLKQLALPQRWFRDASG